LDGFELDRNELPCIELDRIIFISLVLVIPRDFSPEESAFVLPNYRPLAPKIKGGHLSAPPSVHENGAAGVLARDVCIDGRDAHRSKNTNAAIAFATAASAKL
jgi:hypothetical protein